MQFERQTVMDKNGRLDCGGVFVEIFCRSSQFEICITIEVINHLKTRKSVSTLLPNVPLFPEDAFLQGPRLFPFDLLERAASIIRCR